VAGVGQPLEIRQIPISMTVSSRNLMEVTTKNRMKASARNRMKASTRNQMLNDD
jgi:hypothetical protein